MTDPIRTNQDRRAPWRDYHAYSWRLRVGLIVPPNNTIAEIEFAALAPEGVSAHATRMALHLDMSHGFEALYADLEQPLKHLAEASVDVVAYGCTASSIQVPLGELARRMGAVAGVPALSTAEALVEALHALGARRLAVATPYLPAINEHERRFLEAHGFAVLAIEGLGIGETVEDFRYLARVPPEAVYRLARRVDRPDADAILISCMDLATLPVLQRLETDCGKPVVTSNLATFWACLRRGGVADRIDGVARLLAEH
jgi:maleate cis-trans isomerase